jgi:Glycosyltransferase family 87
MSRIHNSSGRSSRLRTEFGPPLAGAAAFVLSWSLLVYSHVFQKWLIGDVRFYDVWGNRIAIHDLPYGDFRLEYPPGAIPAFAAPVYARKLAGYHGIYLDWFRVEILVLGLLTIAATAWALHSLDASLAHRYGALVFGGFAALLLGPIAVSRYDYWPALLAILGVAALLARRDLLACAFITAGFVAKIYPLVLLPIALVVLWRRRRLRGVAEGVGVSAAVAAAGFAPFLVWAPHGLWEGMWRQASRPLQVEALAASFWFVAHQVAGLHVHTVKSYGSDNLVTPGADAASTLSGVAVILALLLVWIWFARSAAGKQEIAIAAAAAVVAYIAFNKVFSPQYLVWLFPLVPLVRGRRGLQATALLAVVTGLTQIWEPYHYPALYEHHEAWVSWLLLARDLLVVSLLAVLVWPRRSELPAEELEAASAAVV